MESVRGFISTELRLPNETSSAKKRYVTFKCHKCDEVVEKIYTASKFVDECSSCSKGAFTTDQFTQRGKEIFGDKYDYSQTKYRNKRSDVTIICPVHGEFTQKGQEHLEGHGCRRCGDEKRGEVQQFSVEVWKERLNNFPKISFKEEPTTLGYYAKALFKCEDHGDFEASLGNLLKTKHICQKCGYFSHQRQSVRSHLQSKKAYVYYVYFPDLKKFKLGVASSLTKRINYFGTPAVVILKKRFTYLKAVSIEHELMNALEQFRYKGSTKLLPSGNTELFDEDVYEYIIRALQE